MEIELYFKASKGYKMLFDQADLDLFRQSAKPGDEVEVRFGHFMGKNFVSSVEDIQAFNDLRNFILKNKASVYSETEDFYYPDNLRLSVDSNGNKVLIRKIKKYNFDKLHSNIRIGIASEEIVSEIPEELPAPLYFRKKKRWSLKIQNKFQIDLTEIFETKVSYEVELEILNLQISLNELNNVVMKFYLNVYGTLYSYTPKERYTVIRDFNISNGSQIRDINYTIDHTVLDQVRNLKIRDLTTGGIVPSDSGQIMMLYGADIKVDGFRKFLFIHSTGTYLISAPKSVSKILEYTTETIPYLGTIIQGELIPDESLLEDAPEIVRKAKYRIFFYDTLSICSSSLRSQPFRKRQDYLDRILKLFNQIPIFYFKKKIFREFTDKTFFQVNQEIINNRYWFKTDGIIYQPLDQDYNVSVQTVPSYERSLDKYPETVKWKPVELLTIDFIIEKEANQVTLLSNLTGRNPVPFKGSRRYAFTSNDIENNSLLERSPSGRILEFAWNSEKKKLFALKPRDDKAKPNNLDIAKEIWDDIHHPIRQELLEGRVFGLVFRYHNREKTKLYKSLYNPKSLLSIGMGKGGDADKIQDAGIKIVYAVEPNEENREILKRRLENIKNVIIPAFGQNIPLIYEYVSSSFKKQFDVVEYMLSLSFFFDTEDSFNSIIHTIYYFLTPGGKLLIFTIDGRKVINFFNNPQNCTIDNTLLRSNFRMITFDLETNGAPTEIPQLTENSPIDPRYQIKVNIPGSIVQNQTEYLVNIPKLTSALSKIGVHLVSENSATSEKFMTKEELAFTSMFTSLIYQRT